MIKYTNCFNINLDTPLDECYGWVTSAGVHFIGGSDTIINFWALGDTDVTSPTVTCRTLGDVIRSTNICTPDEIIKVLYSDKDFTIEV